MRVDLTNPRKELRLLHFGGHGEEAGSKRNDWGYHSQTTASLASWAMLAGVLTFGGTFIWPLRTQSEQSVRLPFFDPKEAVLRLFAGWQLDARGRFYFSNAIPSRNHFAYMLDTSRCRDLHHNWHTTGSVHQKC